MRVPHTTNRGEGDPSVSSRRHVLRLAALGSLGLIAGCQGDGGSGDDSNGTDVGTDERATSNFRDDGTATTPTPNPEDLEDVNQSFYIPTGRHPEEVNFFHLDTHGFYEWEYYTHEHPVWGKWVHSDYHGQGDLNYQKYENVVTEDDRVEITVRDDVTWSNGEPILGRDVLIGPISQRLHSGAMTFEAVEERGPTAPWDAITDYEYDGRTAVIYGEFEDIIDQLIWLRLLVENGPRYPTTEEPWEEYADRMFEVMDMAKNGEINPWESDDATLRDEVQEELYGEDGSDQREALHERFRDPEEVIVDGAWTLKEIRGDQEVLLEPNEEHRNADLINFDEIVLEFTGEERVIWNLLQSGHFDMAQTDPQPHVAEEFHDQYEQYLAPDNNGVSIVLNHGHEPLDDPRVRQALMAAIDTTEVVDTVNPLAWEPVQTPGADNPATPDFLDDSWYEENLRSYEQDQEFAAELMNAAGFERDGSGTWIGDDGEPIELTIWTANPAPEVEPVLATQLTGFGINAEYQTLESAIMEDNMDSGNLEMWTGNHNAGTAFTMVTGWTYTVWRDIHQRRTQWFEGDIEQNIEQTPYDDEGFIKTVDPAALEHLTIKAPPVGEFDGDLQEYPVVSMTYRFENGTQEEVEELWPKLLWLGNWYLPALPLANNYKLFFLNTDNWQWSSGSEVWDYAGVTTRFMPQDLHSWGDAIHANPDNPKD